MEVRVFGKCVAGCKKKPKEGTFERHLWNIRNKQFREGWTKKQMGRTLKAGALAAATIITGGAAAGWAAGAAGMGVAINENAKDKVEKERREQEQKISASFASASDSPSSPSSSVGFLGITLLLGFVFFVINFFRN